MQNKTQTSHMYLYSNIKHTNISFDRVKWFPKAAIVLTHAVIKVRVKKPTYLYFHFENQLRCVYIRHTRNICYAAQTFSQQMRRLLRFVASCVRMKVLRRSFVYCLAVYIIQPTLNFQHIIMNVKSECIFYINILSMD